MSAPSLTTFPKSPTCTPLNFMNSLTLSCMLSFPADSLCAVPLMWRNPINTSTCASTSNWGQSCRRKSNSSLALNWERSNSSMMELYFKCSSKSLCSFSQLFSMNLKITLSCGSWESSPSELQRSEDIMFIVCFSSSSLSSLVTLIQSVFSMFFLTAFFGLSLSMKNPNTMGRPPCSMKYLLFLGLLVSAQSNTLITFLLSSDCFLHRLISNSNPCILLNCSEHSYTSIRLQMMSSTFTRASCSSSSSSVFLRYPFSTPSTLSSPLSVTVNFTLYSSCEFWTMAHSNSAECRQLSLEGLPLSKKSNSQSIRVSTCMSLLEAVSGSSSSRFSRSFRQWEIDFLSSSIASSSLLKCLIRKFHTSFCIRIPTTSLASVKSSSVNSVSNITLSIAISGLGWSSTSTSASMPSACIKSPVNYGYAETCCSALIFECSSASLSRKDSGSPACFILSSRLALRLCLSQVTMRLTCTLSSFTSSMSSAWLMSAWICSSVRCFRASSSISSYRTRSLRRASSSYYSLSLLLLSCLTRLCLGSSEF